AAESDTVTVGVPVGEKIDFIVTSPVPEVRPGQKVTLEVTYQNTGSAAVRSAEARISAVDPFTSNDDTAYLGDMAPGESRTALYEVTVASGATPKTYGLDSEIRYRDALDNSQISDTIKVQVEVVQGEGLIGVLSNPVVLILIIALIGAGLYYILVQRKKK
ncbi:MAG TPA: NEW3 domain-containing protein, partial [Methanomicrobiales archaeon]|nr:NEW3 domain-containing protein [Methanomicrobiales archaeon]